MTLGPASLVISVEKSSEWIRMLSDPYLMFAKISSFRFTPYLDNHVASDETREAAEAQGSGGFFCGQTRFCRSRAVGRTHVQPPYSGRCFQSR
jgi:hypothetical protein